MKKQKSSTEYHGGRIKNLVDSVIAYMKKNPDASPEDVHRGLMMAGQRDDHPHLKGYGRKDPCFNCGRSMKISVYTADVGHALLLLAMAKAVREETRKGIEFTKANRVHIDRLPIDTSTKKRQSQLGYLGLIKPAASGRSGYWLITAWGWKALRGEPIPRSVKYWNRHLIERSPETTTLGEMMRTHREKIEQTIRRGRAVKIADHRSDFAGYEPAEWAEYAGVVDQATIFHS